MARVRNVYDAPLELHLGDWVAHADIDETIDVPDELFVAYAWPPRFWAVVTEPASGGPNRSATKADWVEWAVRHGMPAEEAEAATKDDLIHQFG